VKVANRTREETICNLFSQIADRYEIINSLISFNQHLKWVRFAISKMDLKSGQNALDVCCGTGVLAREMAKKIGSQGQVTGLDFCEDMLKIAKSKIQKGQSPPLRLIKGNAMSLPFSADEFDRAAIGFALRNVASVEKVLSEMYRVIKPGGIVVALDMARPATPLLRNVFSLYLNYLVTFIGRIGTGSSGSYDWLAESLNDYPSPLQIRDKFFVAGFSQVTVYYLAFGVITVHVGKK
jgi:demethylmenaquinone methyltransferase/2-methoxy-6-polyprenyl-1,4-benzoquinol methylase